MNNRIKTLLQSFLRVFETKQAREDRLRFERIYDRLSKFPAGRELLDVKDKLKVRVRFSRKLPPKVSGNFSPFNRLIRLGASRSDDDVIATLAHEVRHAWQFDVLGIGSILHGPRVKANFTRMIEGDAYSFQNAFMERLKDFESKGVETALPMKALRACSFLIMQAYMSGYEERAIKKIFDAKVDVEDTRNPLFKTLLRFFPMVYSPWGGSFSSKVNLRNLRKICTVGFDPEGENYLADMSHKELQKALQKNSHPDLIRANIKQTGHAMAALRKVFHEARRKKPGVVQKAWYKISSQPTGHIPHKKL